jgi:hypothetical protein
MEMTIKAPSASQESLTRFNLIVAAHRALKSQMRLIYQKLTLFVFESRHRLS